MVSDRSVGEGALWIVGRVIERVTPGVSVSAASARMIADGDAAVVAGCVVEAVDECRSQEDALIMVQRRQSERGGEWVSLMVVPL